jgi:ribonucleotide monophosphatase NagD (HAD superfamily)
MPIYNSNTGASTGSQQFPLFGLIDSESEAVKNAHDTYDVYVNEEYVGKKVLVTESEEVEDVVGFLKRHGVQHISAELEGDHYVIRSKDAEHVKHILEAYLQNR